MPTIRRGCTQNQQFCANFPSLIRQRKLWTSDEDFNGRLHRTVASDLRRSQPDGFPHFAQNNIRRQIEKLLLIVDVPRRNHVAGDYRSILFRSNPQRLLQRCLRVRREIEAGNDRSEGFHIKSIANFNCEGYAYFGRKWTVVGIWNQP